MNWGNIRDNSIQVTGTYAPAAPSNEYPMPGVEAGGTITEDDPADVEVEDLDPPVQPRLPASTLPMPTAPPPVGMRQSVMPQPRQPAQASWGRAGAQIGAAIGKATKASVPVVPITAPQPWAKPAMIIGIAGLVLFGLYYVSK